MPVIVAGGDPVVVLYVWSETTGLFSQQTTLTGMGGNTFYPTIQGTGDAILQCFFGPLTDPIFGGVQGPIPTGGAFPGVLARTGNGVFTKLSSGSAFNYGSAVPSGNVVSFETIYGMTQTPDGWANGSWFFEVQILGTDVFSNLMGCGWGLQYNGGAGMDANYWANNGQYGATNPNGGALVKTGGINDFTPTFAAQGDVLATGTGIVLGEGSLFGAAIFMPPFIETTIFDPQQLVQVSMPCMPCCPIDACIPR
jgi:hypothetical protein